MSTNNILELESRTLQENDPDLVEEAVVNMNDGASSVSTVQDSATGGPAKPYCFVPLPMGISLWEEEVALT